MESKSWSSIARKKIDFSSFTSGLQRHTVDGRLPWYRVGFYLILNDLCSVSDNSSQFLKG